MTRAALFVATVMLSGCATQYTSWIVVPDSSLVELIRHQQNYSKFAAGTPQPLGYAEKHFVLTGHRIEAGGGTVLAMRRFNPGSWLSVDSAMFEKVTARVPMELLVPGAALSIPNENGTVVFYSSGSSNFPGAGGCFGYATSGTITIDEVSAARAAFRMELQFQLAGPLGNQDSCAPRTFRGVFSGSYRTVQSLTPWQGARGQSIYEEGIRSRQEPD